MLNRMVLLGAELRGREMNTFMVNVRQTVGIR